MKHDALVLALVATVTLLPGLASASGVGASGDGVQAALPADTSGAAVSGKAGALLASIKAMLRDGDGGEGAVQIPEEPRWRLELLQSQVNPDLVADPRLNSGSAVGAAVRYAF